MSKSVVWFNKKDFSLSFFYEEPNGMYFVSNWVDEYLDSLYTHEAGTDVSKDIGFQINHFDKLIKKAAMTMIYDDGTADLVNFREEDCCIEFMLKDDYTYHEYICSELSILKREKTDECVGFEVSWLDYFLRQAAKKQKEEIEKAFQELIDSEENYKEQVNKIVKDICKKMK